MMWFTITMLILALVVINDKLKYLKKVIEENDARYGNRFTDDEVRITKIENTIGY